MRSARLALLRHRVDALHDAARRLLRPPTMIGTGSRRMSLASLRISGAMVAENISVCRSTGSARRMRRMSGRKPMSSMRSASSSTSTSSGDEVDVVEAHVVEEPARRRHDDLGAGAQRPLLRPHVDAAHDRHRRQADVVAERQRLLVDLHGQLARRREDQGPAHVRAGRCCSRCRIGSRNAAVLPVPVEAQPIRSRPARATGMASAWIGVGRVYPMSATASVSAGISSNSLKDVVEEWVIRYASSPGCAHPATAPRLDGGPRDC